MADKKVKTVTREDAHGNKVEVAVGVDGKNPVSVNNPTEKALGGVSDGIYTSASQPFEGSFGDGQDLARAAQGDPGHKDSSNTVDGADDKSDDSKADDKKTPDKSDKAS